MSVQFEYKQKPYFLPALTQGDKDRWHIWCNAFARQQLKRDYRAVEEEWLAYDDYRRTADRTQDRIDSGYYHFDEPGGKAFMSVDHAFTMLIYFCLVRHEPKVTEKEVRAMAKDIPQELGIHFRDANANPTQLPASAGETIPPESDTLSEGESSKSAA